MRRILLILATTFILSLPAFAEWDIEYNKSKTIAYLTTINTNQGEAWLVISVDGDNLTIFMQFQDMYLNSENIKVEYKLNSGDSKFITGKRDREKLVIFATSRNHENVLDFIEKLKASDELFIKFNDGYKKARTFIFDVSNLQEALDKAF